MPTHKMPPDALPSEADGAPVFDHPWQANAFSLTVNLHKGGFFTWPEWVDMFSATIKGAPARPGEAANDAYHRQWLAALETIVAAHGLAAREDITLRADEWRRAYLNTPHGHPVELGNAVCPPDHDHEHVHPGGPIAVSAAVRT